MKLELLIIIFCIYLFYLFKKNKFKGGVYDDTYDKLTEFNTEFNNEYKKSLEGVETIRTNAKKILSKEYGRTMEKFFEEPLDSVRSNIKDMKDLYNKVFNNYFKLIKISKISKDDKDDKDNIDLTQCSHNIFTVSIYSPNIKLYLYSNSQQHGKDYDGFSYGNKDDEIAWTIEFCGKNLTNNTVVHIKSTYYNKYLMSDSLKGEGFKWNENRDINKAWNLIRIKDHYFKLQSLYFYNQNINRCCLDNNIPEGGKFSWSFPKTEDRYISWKIEIMNIHTENTSDTEKVIRKQLDSISKKEVHIKNNTTGKYLHGNSAENGGFSMGGKRRDHNWYLVYSGKLTDQTLVYIQSKSENNKNKYWLSSSEERFNWSYNKVPDATWSLIKLNGNNNYAIKSNHKGDFIESHKATEGNSIDYSSNPKDSNWEIEFV